LTERFRIHSPHVVAETLGGEATIVDLDSGTYYALNESGSLIWDGLIAGADPAAIAGTLASAYELEAADASRAVDRLVERLNAAKLIVSDGNSASNGVAPRIDGRQRERSNGSADFAEPELSSYTDMQELLLLDPIHEVDESGWPSQP
jgi:Coenzyme PQQ synthesis protein D (PqqD)